MAIVAVAGDCATTTTVALASAWSAADDVLVVEPDPRGGDLAAWFDLPVAPSLSTVVTRVLDGAWPEIERHTRLATNGLRVLTSPPGAAEAAQAVGEAGRAVVPTLASMRSPTTLADTGMLALAPTSHPFVGAASVTVVVHRQAPQSARAAAVRLQRLAEQVDVLVGQGMSTVVAVVGAAPFGLDEIEQLLARSSGPVTVVGLPVDDLSAAVLAGRTGVSERRLARLPLLRAARDLAAVVERAVEETVGGLWRAAR
jgi:MinD-like ATPase involved in chromosome partitioning or flagellar assembly